MGQHLGIAAGVQFVVGAGRVVGLTGDSQGDMITLPFHVAVGGGGVGERLATRAAVEQATETVVEIAAEIATANGGGSAMQTVEAGPMTAMVASSCAMMGSLGFARLSRWGRVCEGCRDRRSGCPILSDRCAG